MIIDLEISADIENVKLNSDDEADNVNYSEELKISEFI